jgi:NhaC family Na+:H+ antiporter
MAATLGVATFSYAPYAVFNLVSPLVAIVVAYANFRMPRLPVGHEMPAGQSEAAASPNKESDER